MLYDSYNSYGDAREGGRGTGGERGGGGGGYDPQGTRDERGLDSDDRCVFSLFWGGIGRGEKGGRGKGTMARPDEEEQARSVCVCRLIPLKMETVCPKITGRGAQSPQGAATYVQRLRVWSACPCRPPRRKAPFPCTNSCVVSFVATAIRSKL